ncbi:hypothetical protein B0T09DRAFT_126534 [Sordaria sp. MPI-SDFR-AT-0083]|nr:hypothetical protein B0T09DRAFT_126534 [Sordaria sp. MPI-SDFR-AT-0083]
MAGHLQPPIFQLPDTDTSHIPTLKGTGLGNAPTSGFAFTPISPLRGRVTSSNPAISAATTAVQTSADESQSDSDSSSGTDSDSAQSSAEEDSGEEDSVAEGDEALDSEADTSEIESYLRDLDSNNVEGRHPAGDSDNGDEGDSDSDDDADNDDTSIDGGSLIFESDHEPSPEYDRVPNHGFGVQNDRELEPAQILSDIVQVPVGDLGVINPAQQPATMSAPTSMATTITVATVPTSTVPTKRKAGGEWDDARRKRVSEALKQRWADGRTAHVHDILRKHNAVKAKGEALGTPAGHPSASEAKAQDGALDPSARYAPIDIAASGRAYREWEVGGVPHTTHGAILPDGYQVGDGFFPWKCPVQKCVKSSETLHNLGQHFKSAHHGHMFHDNQDGTLTDLGPWTEELLQNNMPRGRGAIVVSMEKTSASLDDSMQVDETIEKPSASVDNSMQLDKYMALDKVPLVTSSSEPVGDRASMWAYVEPLLVKHRGQAMPRGGYVYELSILPRVRELSINFEWQRGHPFMDSQPRDIAAVIIQLTGEPAATPCDKCKLGRGPWKGCIMISSKAEDGPLANIYSCAACFYHFGQTYCSHKSWGAERSRRILRSRGKNVESIQALTRSNIQSRPRSLTEHKEDNPQFDNQPLPPNNGQRSDELTKSTSTVHLTEDQKRLWDYIKPHLAFTKEVPEVGYIKELLSLPRVRDLVLPLSEPFAEKHTRDIAALIIQVTGDGLDGIPCTRCRREQGPLFKGGCVAIKTTAHPEARRVYQACANCTYDSKGGACSRGKGIPVRPQPPFPRKAPETNKGTDGVWLKRGGAGGGGAAWALALAAPRPPRQAAPAKATTSLVSAGEVQSAYMFDMEEWEVAPGRILKSNSDKPIGFAYSKAFLSTSHTVPVCNDVQFQVKTIHTGQTITMDPEDGQTRLVSVATGKLRVKVGDEPEVMIGQHGMFRIEPGQACTIENRVYVDATLHVTHLSGYF